MESDIVAPPPRQNQNSQQPSQGQPVPQQNSASEAVRNKERSDLHLGVNPQNMTQELPDAQAQPPQSNVQNQEASPQIQNDHAEQTSQPQPTPKKSHHTAVIVVAVLIFLILAGIAIYAGLIREPVT